MQFYVWFIDFRSKDSRGSKDDSPAPPGGEGALLKVLASEVSLSSLESDSQESQKRQRRLDEITEVVDGKLEPLAEDMHDLKGKLDQVNIWHGVCAAATDGPRDYSLTLSIKMSNNSVGWWGFFVDWGITEIQ